jgi:prepilin-type N-terminal cleavage/methylation domain-containing protein
MKAQRPPSAFTMIEVLVATAICTVVLAGVSIGSAALRQSFEAASFQINAQNEQMRVLDYLSRDVRGALSLSVTNSGTRLNVLVPAATSSALNLKLGAPFFSTVSAASSTSQSITYFLQGGQLMREVEGTQTLLAESLNGLTFSLSGAILTANVEFSPRFGSLASAAAGRATRLSNQWVILNAAGS